MSTLLERGRQGLPLTCFDVVDMHSHLGRTAFSTPDVTAADLLRVMERTGVATTVTTAMLPVSPEETEAQNAQVLGAVRDFPGRFLGYYRPCPSAAPVSVDVAGKALDAGFSGMKLHNANGIPYTHACYEPYLLAADERRMPVLLHSWGAEEEFRQFRTISTRYSRLMLLLAHAGSQNEEQYILVARECENVVLELTMSRTPRGLVERLAAGVGSDKVVWGSDICFINQAHQLGKVLGAHLSEEDKLRILSGNARRVLGRVRT